MKEYYVEIPFTGKITVIVEAENAEDAKMKALEECDLDLTQKSELGYELESWELHESVTKGNVFYGILNEISADEHRF